MIQPPWPLHYIGKCIPKLQGNNRNSLILEQRLAIVADILPAPTPAIKAKFGDAGSQKGCQVHLKKSCG